MNESTEKPEQNNATKQSAIDALIGQRLGRFKIESVLGRGSMGTVLRAMDLTLKRPVALKVLPRHVENETDEYRLQQFIREAQSAASLVHPGIVQVFEVGLSNGFVFIAMELLEQGTLQEQIDRNEKLDWREACRIVAQIAEAADFAHKHGIIHRDIKPANILLADQHQAKLADFGLALMIDHETKESSPWQIVGTPYYLAPEAALGRASAKSDVYSLGAVLWYAITGKPPFPIKKLTDVLHAHRKYKLQRMRRLTKDVPANLVNCLKKSLARDPEQRHGNARELALDLYELASIDTPFGPPRVSRSIAGKALGFAAWILMGTGIAAMAYVTVQVLQEKANSPVESKGVAIQPPSMPANPSPTHPTISPVPQPSPDAPKTQSNTETQSPNAEPPAVPDDPPKAEIENETETSATDIDKSPPVAVENKVSTHVTQTPTQPATPPKNQTETQTSPPRIDVLDKPVFVFEADDLPDKLSDTADWSAEKVCAITGTVTVTPQLIDGQWQLTLGQKSAVIIHLPTSQASEAWRLLQADQPKQLFGAQIQVQGFIRQSPQNKTVELNITNPAQFKLLKSYKQIASNFGVRVTDREKLIQLAEAGTPVTFWGMVDKVERQKDGSYTTIAFRGVDAKAGMVVFFDKRFNSPMTRKFGYQGANLVGQFIQVKGKAVYQSKEDMLYIDLETTRNLSLLPPGPLTANNGQLPAQTIPRIDLNDRATKRAITKVLFQKDQSIYVVKGRVLRIIKRRDGQTLITLASPLPFAVVCNTQQLSILAQRFGDDLIQLKGQQIQVTGKIQRRGTGRVVAAMIQLKNPDHLYKISADQLNQN